VRFFAENNHPGFEYPPAVSFSSVGHSQKIARQFAGENNQKRTVIFQRR
jgi:hypothetical protein